jgi:chaperonin GroES
MSKVRVKPLHDRIIVKPVAEEEETKGGILLPDTAKEKPMEGVVMAKGEGKLLDSGTVIKLEVEIDDRVIFSKYAGTEIKIEDEEYLILREEDVLGIILEKEGQKE